MTHENLSCPRYVCLNCGRVEYARLQGRGAGPDAAGRRIRKACREANCRCQPEYRAGVLLGALIHEKETS